MATVDTVIFLKSDPIFKEEPEEGDLLLLLRTINTSDDKVLGLINKFILSHSRPQRDLISLTGHPTPPITQLKCCTVNEFINLWNKSRHQYHRLSNEIDQPVGNKFTLNELIRGIGGMSNGLENKELNLMFMTMKINLRDFVNMVIPSGVVVTSKSSELSTLVTFTVGTNMTSFNGLTRGRLPTMHHLGNISSDHYRGQKLFMVAFYDGVNTAERLKNHPGLTLKLYRTHQSRQYIVNMIAQIIPAPREESERELSRFAVCRLGVLNTKGLVTSNSSDWCIYDAEIQKKLLNPDAVVVPPVAKRSRILQWL